MKRADFWELVVAYCLAIALATALFLLTWLVEIVGRGGF